MSPARLHILSAVLAAPVERLHEMVLLEPRLTTAPPQQLASALLVLRKRGPEWADFETVVARSPGILFQDTDRVLAALDQLRRILPVPILEFVVGEEQSLLQGGLTPPRVQALQSAWDEHGETIWQDHWDQEEWVMRRDLANSAGVYARFVRRSLIHNDRLFS